jgi:hypothetical protein
MISSRSNGSTFQLINLAKAVVAVTYAPESIRLAANGATGVSDMAGKAAR